MRIPETRLTNPRAYLDPLNFATNFVFFASRRAAHAAGTANYWPGYGAGAVSCWMTLFAAGGEVLAEWCEEFGRSANSDRSRQPGDPRAFPTSGIFRPDFPACRRCGRARCRQIRPRYLGEADAGNRSRTATLSCTHDANAWPADRYAGLPAPAPGERTSSGCKTAIPSRSRRARWASTRWGMTASCRSTGLDSAIRQSCRGDFRTDARHRLAEPDRGARRQAHGAAAL